MEMLSVDSHGFDMMDRTLLMALIDKFDVDRSASTASRRHR